MCFAVVVLFVISLSLEALAGLVPDRLQVKSAVEDGFLSSSDGIEDLTVNN